MREVAYEHELGLGAFLRVYFRRERKQILSFMVQLECEYGGERHSVIRYDTSHGFAHCDMLHPYRPQVKVVLEMSFEDAFMYAQRDISSHWQFYRERYETWLITSRKS